MRRRHLLGLFVAFFLMSGAALVAKKAWMARTTWPPHVMIQPAATKVAFLPRVPDDMPPASKPLTFDPSPAPPPPEPPGLPPAADPVPPPAAILGQTPMPVIAKELPNTPSMPAEVPTMPPVEPIITQPEVPAMPGVEPPLAQPKAAPAPEEVAAGGDPVQAVETFVRRNRQEADTAIKNLTQEAETLRARLAKVEAALARWQVVSAALKHEPGAVIRSGVGEPPPPGSSRRPSPYAEGQEPPERDPLAPGDIPAETDEPHLLPVKPSEPGPVEPPLARRKAKISNPPPAKPADVPAPTPDSLL